MEKHLKIMWTFKPITYSYIIKRKRNHKNKILNSNVHKVEFTVVNQTTQITRLLSMSNQFGLNNY